jgi:hypothetical protein
VLRAPIFIHFKVIFATKQDKCWICFPRMSSMKLLVHRIKSFFMISVVEIAVCHEMYTEVNRRLNRHSSKMWVSLPVSGHLCVCACACACVRVCSITEQTGNDKWFSSDKVGILRCDERGCFLYIGLPFNFLVDPNQRVWVEITGSYTI